MAKATNKESAKDQKNKDPKAAAPKKDTKKKGKEAEAASGNKAQDLVQFVKDSWSEFRKIQWPTPRQAANESIVVLATVVFMILLVNVYDAVCGYLLNFILQK